MSEPGSASDGAGGGPALFQAAADQEATARAVAAAAAPVRERTDLSMAGTLDPAVRPHVYGLLRSLADNKYVLGRRYAEWCTGAPALESAVAAAAMAQDELGHARSFYPLLRGFPEGSEEEATAMEERGWQARPTSALACLDQPFADWSGFIAANLVADTAFTTLFEAAVETPYEPLRQRARKIVQEEAAHWVHAAGWTLRLAQDTHRPALEAHLSAVWPHALAWFGLPDDPLLGGLANAGILAAGPGDLRDRLRTRLTPLLEAAGLAALVDDPALPWDRWDPRARRLRPA